MEDNRISLNGCMVYPFKSVGQLIDTVQEKKRVLVAVNAEKVVLSTPQTRDIIKRNIGYCDGAGPVKVLHKHGQPGVPRIPGCELWLHIIEKLAPEGKTFYLIGSRQEVIEETVAKLRHDFPSIKIVAYRNGFIKDKEERKALIQDVVEKKPDVVFVAMGSPRQELLMDEMCQLHPAIYQGLGGSFDVYTGHVKRAPRWLCRLNMEWAYRFYAQPTRLSRLKNYLKFFWQMEVGKLVVNQ